jgi:hypothetical protein
MHTPCRLIAILLLMAPPPAAAEILKAEPPPNQALRNPIDVRLTLSLSSAEARALAWSTPKVVVDGTDYSRAVQPLFDGAVAVYLGDRAVMAERNVSEERIEIRIYGFTAPPGPHQVLVEIARKDSKPLRYQVQYVVLP